MSVLRLFFILCILPFLSFANAEVQDSHLWPRRLAVFPLKSNITDNELNRKVWWNVRDNLASNKLFLVATKNFLEQKDLFQARGKIKTADVVLLSRLLDASALISLELQDRNFYFRVYSAEDGLLLWHKEYKLESSLPVQSLIEKVSLEASNDFIKNISFDGFLIRDTNSGQLSWQESGTWYAKVMLQNKENIKVGESLRFVYLKRNNTESLYTAETGMIDLDDAILVKIQDNEGLIAFNSRPKENTLKEFLPLYFISSKYNKNKETEEQKEYARSLVGQVVQNNKVNTDERDRNTVGLSLLSILALLLIAF